VFVHYGVNPRSENLGWDLAFALLKEHVPAFNTEASCKQYFAKRKTSSGQPTRLNTVGTVALLFEWTRLLDEAPGGKLSDRHLGNQLSKLPRLKALGLDAETIRKLLAQVRRAWSDYKNHRATEFQIQFIEDVAPLIWSQGKGPTPEKEGDETSRADRAV
jgi:hypothetical protein